MKIIHTSDLHLNSKNPERIKALEAIISLGISEDVDLVLVAGDLFDSNQEADKLRPVLRDLLSSLPFKVLSIPGNHDYKAYSSDLNFGNDIKILLKNPFEAYETDEVKIMAVPYSNQNFNDIATSLSVEVDPSKINILLIHCSLDMPYLKEDEFGDEERQLYLPVKSRVLADVGFDYVFAGHFHSRSTESKISDKTIFTYSGSPVSITRKETGKRRVYFLDTSLPKDEMLYFKTLDTFYFDEINLTFYPGKEENVLGDFSKKLQEYDTANVNLNILLEGFISLEENTLKSKLEKIIAKYKQNTDKFKMTQRYRDVREVLSDPMYVIFKNKLDGEDLLPELKEKINEVVILQFSQLKFTK